MELEIKNLNNLLVDKNNKLSKLEEEIKLEREEKADLIHEEAKYRKETEDQRKMWAEETTKLRKELDNINEIVRTNQKGAEENLKEQIEQEKLILLNEQDNDRHAYQKLLQEYHCLEQHCENLEKQLSEQNRQPSHVRNISNGSSIGIDESLTITADIPEDHGYGSYRANAAKRKNLDNIDWKVNGSESQTTSTQSSSSSKPDSDPKVNVGLVLQLQHKLADVERERERLQKRVDEIDMSPKTEKAKNAIRDSIKISELELLNSTLKSNLIELSQSIEEGYGNEKQTDQLKEMQEELHRKSEEIVQLKSVLANQTDNMKSIVSSSARTGTSLTRQKNSTKPIHYFQANT